MKYSRELMSELRRQGFKRTSREDELVIYAKIVGNRRVEVQLWDYGEHRASHYMNGIMNTHPTEFITLTEMKAAIARELSRTDHPPLIV